LFALVGHVQLVSAQAPAPPVTGGAPRAQAELTPAAASADADDKAADTAASAAADAAADAASLDQARDLFEQGLQQVEAGDWAGAEQSFRRVLAVKSSAVVSYNLASALARLGRLIESADLLRIVVRDPSVDVGTRDPAQQLLAEIEAQIGSLTVRVQGDGHELVLQLDGRVLSQGELVQTVSVDPGEHVVLASRKGKTLATETVQVGGRAPLKAEVLFDLREKIVAKPKPDPRVSQLPEEREPRSSSDQDSIWASPWLWAGAGAVVVAGVVIVAAVALGGETTFERPVSGDTDPPVIRGRGAALLGLEAGGAAR
jgi:hypothetical protein